MSPTTVRPTGRLDAPAAPGGASQARPRVLVTRAPDQAEGLLAALRGAALEPVLVPAIEIASAEDAAALEHAAGRLPTYRWLVASSANGAHALLAAADRAGSDPAAAPWAVVGAATRAALERRGLSVVFQPSEATAASLGAELPVAPGDRVLVLRGDLATDALARALAARGADADDVVAYRTLEAPATSRDLLRRALTAGPVAAVVFTSGSTVRGLDALAAAEGLYVSSVPAVCIGEPTARAARAAGHPVIAIAAAAEAHALATCVAEALTRSERPAR